MNNLFFACDWVVQFGDMDFDDVLDTVSTLVESVIVLTIAFTEDGNKFIRFGVSVSSTKVLDQLVERVGKKHNATNWYPITEKDYRGRDLPIRGDEKRLTRQCMQIMFEDHLPTEQLHKKLANEWNTHLIFRAKWIPRKSDSETLSSVRKLFEVAEGLEAQLVLIHQRDDIRHLMYVFFLIIPSIEILGEYNRLAPGVPGMTPWLPVEKTKLPNFVHFRGPGSGLYEYATYNNQLDEYNKTSIE